MDSVFYAYGMALVLVKLWQIDVINFLNLPPGQKLKSFYLTESLL